MDENYYLDKDIIKLPNGHEDERGIIQPLCDLNIDNCIELDLFDKIEVSKPVRNFLFKNKPATHFIFELKNLC